MTQVDSVRVNPRIFICVCEIGKPLSSGRRNVWSSRFCQCNGAEVQKTRATMQRGLSESRQLTVDCFCLYESTNFRLPCHFKLRFLFLQPAI